jgi:hypothetical protein
MTDCAPLGTRYTNQLYGVYGALLAPWYRDAAQSITAPGQSPEAKMGSYDPTAAYCSTATFERGGESACLPQRPGSPRSKEHKSKTA